MRDCPVCGIPLKEETLHRQAIDRCEKCRGIFFDHGELASILNIVRIYRSFKLDEAEIDTLSDNGDNRVIDCPSCGMPMAQKEVGGAVVDFCDSCGGVWLDGGEIQALKMAENHVRENINLYIRLGM
ncbi:MAG: zf-TFIIB domain-containing protein [Candidatus Cloacimonetes bacterium]|nr:zf-TFIIB domain-containing protein [Candidatus Cloacimonadota bacterium]